MFNLDLDKINITVKNDDELFFRYIDRIYFELLSNEELFKKQLIKYNNNDIIFNNITQQSMYEAALEKALTTKWGKKNKNYKLEYFTPSNKEFQFRDYLFGLDKENIFAKRNIIVDKKYFKDKNNFYKTKSRD